MAGDSGPAMDELRRHEQSGIAAAQGGGAGGGVEGGGREAVPDILRPGLQGGQEQLGRQQLPPHAGTLDQMICTLDMSCAIDKMAVSAGW